MPNNNPYDRARARIKNDGGRAAMKKRRLIRDRDERRIAAGERRFECVSFAEYVEMRDSQVY